MLPDPPSRRAPHGVHGLSRTFDPDAYTWSDQLWTGRQLPGGIVPSCTWGTFTREGTLLAAIERLDHLVELGITLVEVMPVNAFNGRHQAQLDGVLWGAVHGGVQQPSRVPGLRRRLSPARAGCHPGRHLRPPRSQWQLPARVRPLHRRRPVQHLG